MLNVEGNFLPNVDYAACFARGIEVLGIGPVFGQPVAELALGMALAAARDIPRGDSEIRAGTESMFDDGVNGGSFLLAGKTVGLVGCGNLARSLLPLLRPFGCELLAHDPWLPDDALSALGVEPVALLELFARSKVVFILSPVTTENAGLIGAECFDAMAPGSVVVLVSRAAVVDWPALLDAAAPAHPGCDRRVPRGADPGPRAGPSHARHDSLRAPRRQRAGDLAARRRDGGRRPRGAPRRPGAARMQRADPLTVGRLRSRPIG